VARASDAHQFLRFDCFEREPHWHLDPDGHDEISALDANQDPVSFASGELSRDLEGYLERAGWKLADPLDPALRAATLEQVELALRNPPADLDTVDLAVLRARRGEKWRSYGSEALAAWVADMDFPIAEPIRQVLRRALRSGDLGYPLNPKPEGLPSVFASRMRERFGWEIEPRRVEVITDVVQGIYLALQVYSEPGDGVVVQTPIYAPFLHAVRETGRRLVSNPLAAGPSGYQIDFDGLERSADRGARMFLLCNPHNPTGRVFRQDELERLAQFAVERDLVVVSDEIHGDLVFPGHRHRPFASVSAEAAQRTLTLTSATKAFSIAGLRCAVAHFGSAELRDRFLSVPRHSRGGINGPGLMATEAAWRHSQPWLDQVIAYLDENRRCLARFVEEHLPGVVHHSPEATYLAWLDCRALELDPHPVEFFLERARVALSDGANFGPGHEGFVRLNFGTSRAILSEILERMAKAVQQRAR
jgi:cystathionine beta-lyase